MQRLADVEHHVIRRVYDIVDAFLADTLKRRTQPIGRRPDADTRNVRRAKTRAELLIFYRDFECICFRLQLDVGYAIRMRHERKI